MNTKLTRALETVWRLGPKQIGWWAIYRLGLSSGWLRARTPLATYQSYVGRLATIFHLPKKIAYPFDLDEAEDLVNGRVCLWGNLHTELPFGNPPYTQHWTAYERGMVPWGVEDVKDLWEPARFGWAFTLARAYTQTSDERYAATFWRYAEDFLATNPPNAGPQWTSGQEIALRLVAWLFALQVLAASPHTSSERVTRLAGAIAAHAQRIVPTLSYARAQHNNHLISEGLGLVAAGLALADHPLAAEWLRLGRAALHGALRAQIASDGTYAQHSLNYHRLMLLAALIAEHMDGPFPIDMRK